jgi:hypothetical protein
MAQRIVTTCDAHAAHDEDAPGVTWTVTLLAPGESKPTTWEVDLCDQDGKTLTDLSVMLGAIGRQTDGPRRRATAARESTREARAHGAHPCPVDGCGKVSSTSNGLQTHVRHDHGMTMAEAMGEPLPYACDSPACLRAFSTPQGLGAHRKSVHGIAGAHRQAEAS